jgi:hypothetical protein
MNAEAFSVRAFVGPGLAGGSTSGRCSGSRGTTTRGATSGTPGSSSQASPVRGRLPGARPLRTRDSPDVALRLGSTARREARSLGIVQRSWTRSTTTTSRATACRSATGARGRDEQCSRRLIQNVATSSEAAGPKKHQRWRCRRMSHRGLAGATRDVDRAAKRGPTLAICLSVVRTKPHKTVSRRVAFGPSRSVGVLCCLGAGGGGARGRPCALSGENKPLARKNITGRRWAFRLVVEAGEGDRAFAKRTPADPGHCAAGAARRSIATKRTAAKNANGREAVPPARAL